MSDFLNIVLELIYWFSIIISYCVLIEESMEILWISFLFAGALTQTNLISNGDFQAYSPYNLSAYPTGVIVYMGNYAPDGHWYGNPTFQVKKFMNPTVGVLSQNRLDIITDSSNYRSCHNFFPQINRTYLLKFQYMVDYNKTQPLSVLISNKSIAYLLATYSSVLNYSSVFRATNSVQSLCFIGYYDEINNPEPFRAPLIDNVGVFQATVTEFIQFLVTNDQFQIFLTSNCSISPQKITAFYGTTIQANTQQLVVKNFKICSESFLGPQNLQIVLDGTSPLSQNQTLIINIPPYQYTDLNGYGVEFIVTNVYYNLNASIIHSVQAPVQAPVQAVTNSTQNIQPVPSTDMQVPAEPNTSQSQYNLEDALIDGTSNFLQSIKTLRVLAFTALVFKLIAFANISILYLFLDIENLEKDIRESFQRFAQVIFGKGMIESFMNYILHQEVDFSFFYFPTTEKISFNRETSGSQFQIIDLSSNLTKCYLDDFLVLMLNVLKLVGGYFLVKKLRKNEKFRNLLSCQQIRAIFHVLLFTEIISTCPVWILALFASFANSPQGSASLTFTEKMNFSVQICTFLIFVILFTMLHRVLYTSQIKSDITQNQILKIFFIGLTPSKTLLFDKYERLESLIFLQLILVSPFCTIQRVEVFLTFFTMFRFLGFKIAWRIKQKTLSFTEYILRAIFSSSLHFSFVGLYIISVLFNHGLIDATTYQEHSKIASNIVLYGFILGCLFEILVAFLRVIITIFTILKKICQAYFRSNQIIQNPTHQQNKNQQRKTKQDPKKNKEGKQEKKKKKEKPKKSEKIIKKQLSQQQQIKLKGHAQHKKGILKEKINTKLFSPKKNESNNDNRIKLNILIKKKKQKKNALNIIEEEPEQIDTFRLDKRK